MATSAELLRLAASRYQSRDLEGAEAFAKQILQADPAHAAAHHLLGLVAHQSGRQDVAIDLLRQAIALDPADAECHFNLGNVFMGLGQSADAAQCYRETLLRNPQHAQAHNNLGIVLKKQGRLDEAAAAYRQALISNPNHANAHNNLGNVLIDQGHLTEAIACYRQALSIDPRHAETSYSLSVVLARLGQFPEALEQAEQALNVDPDLARAKWQRSLLRLLAGDFEEGWRDYGQRWTLPNFTPRSFTEPRWTGSSLQGKTILVYAEQGLGDTIQFVRYLPLVKERGGAVLLECQPSLAPLLAGLAGIDQLLPAGAVLPHFDLQAPLLDLPGIFRTKLATIPAAVPYLAAEPGLLRHWRHKLAGVEGVKVGIAWHGNTKNPGDRHRSIPLDSFAPLAQVPGIRLMSLQVGAGTEQLASAPFAVTDLGSDFDPASLNDLAAVLKNMDLVVTVDTAVAHLAGALAVATWVLVPLLPDWRWLTECTDSPWYPTLRLFRQKSRGAWGEVFESVQQELILHLLARMAGRRHEAVALLRQASALNPANALWHFHLGAILMSQGLAAEAIERYRNALRINPNYAPAHNNLGNALKSQGQMAAAVACYRQALLCDHRNAHAHYNLGNALKDQGQLPEAALCYRAALAVNPRHAQAHNNLGVILKNSGRLEEAVDRFRSALAIQPDDAQTYYNLGTALKQQERLAEAAECFRHVLRCAPRHAEAHQSLSIVLTQLGQVEEALVHIEQALRLQPDQVTGRWQRSLLRLLLGDFTGGWQDFEQRWAQPNVAPRSLPGPRWDGGSLKGKTILVYAEQGFGDTIQFVRYLPMVKECGGTVVFECQRPLTGLLAGVAGADQIIPAGARLPAYDVQAPLLSLPALFGTTLPTIPAGVPYLRANAALAEHWRRELASLQDLRVGIAWQGSADHPGDRCRSIPLTRFVGLTRVPGTQLVSVQKGPGSEQLKAYAGRLTKASRDQAPCAELAAPILDLSDRLDTFVDTAAALMNLDLIVTVDSAVAHLAGALGLPVWVLLPFAPDWRWLRERTDSPWYPTMRLFRQNRLGEWDEVFERVAAEMQAIQTGPRR